MKRTHPGKYYIAAAISSLTFLIYLSSLQNSFVDWDDDLYVSGNPFIRSIDSAFFKWAFFDFYAANWHPLTWISHAMDYAVWGLDPMGHHLTNNILHAINTFLVVLLVLRLIEAVHNSRFTISDSSAPSDPPVAGDSRFALIAAGITGLLFGLHPLHVESVAWVAERKDLLCALFYLLSIMMYVTFRQAQGDNVILSLSKDKRYILCLFFFILALMSKPMAVSLPCVLLILDWYPFKRISSINSLLSSLIEKIPFIFLSFISSALTLMAQKSGETMTLTEYMPFTTRSLLAAKSLIAYLWKMLLPFNLIPYYPYPRDVSPLSLTYLVPVFLVTGLTIICLAISRKHKLWLAVWSYYLVTLAPVLGIVQVGGQAMADRYVYLPSLGPFLTVGLAAAIMHKKIENPERRIALFRFLGAAVLICLFVFMSYLTFRQTGMWRNSIDLWSAVLEKGPANNSLAYYQRAVAFSKTGRFDKAIDDYNRTIALEPYHYEVYVSRGEVFLNTGRLYEAAMDFETAVTLKPLNYQYYDKLGLIYGRLGRFVKAIESFTKSVELNPGNAAAYVNRGYTYAMKGEYSRAFEDYNKAIELDHNFAHAYFSRGNLYFSTGNKERAIADMRKACELGEEGGCDALHAFLERR